MKLTLGLCTLSLTFLSSDARPSFIARIPNGNGVSGVAALGHVSPSGGGATNAFGEAFEAAGHQWTAELCQADSDGDGATNGEELGDACCSWTASTGFGDSSSTLSPTHPGVSNSFTADELTAMKCGGEADVDASASSVAASSSSGDSLTSDSQTSTSSGFGSSGSFGDVMAPYDQPRFSPGPKLDETPQTPVTSGAGRQQTFVAGIVLIALVLV